MRSLIIVSAALLGACSHQLADSERHTWVFPNENRIAVDVRPVGDRFDYQAILTMSRFIVDWHEIGLRFEEAKAITFAKVCEEKAPVVLWERSIDPTVSHGQFRCVTSS